jgi:hypothetical protein
LDCLKITLPFFFSGSYFTTPSQADLNAETACGNVLQDDAFQTLYGMYSSNHSSTVVPNRDGDNDIVSASFPGNLHRAHLSSAKGAVPCLISLIEPPGRVLAACEMIHDKGPLLAYARSAQMLNLG